MTDPAIHSLISRLEAASGPDREIDALVCVLFYDIPDPPGAFKLGVRSPARPLHDDWQVDCVNDAGLVRSYIPKPYTAYLDAITALIARALPGCSPGVGQNLHHKHWHARLSELDAEGGPLTLGEADAPTPALALCLALVRTKAAQMEKSE